MTEERTATMAVIIQDQTTAAALKKIGCLTDGALDLRALVPLLATALETHHMAADLADVANAEVTVAQLLKDVTGVDDDQVFDLARPLLVPSATGRVQRAVSNGHVLCAKRLSVQVVAAGQTRAVNVGTRFLSSDPDVLRQYVLDARATRFENFLTETHALGELVAARQPGMATDVAGFYQDIADKVTVELGTVGSVTP
jgi:hypothetical protein